MKSKGIHCRMIIEMVGAPEGHIIDTLKLVLKTLKEEEKGIEVLDGKVHKPKKQGEFFSTFAEIEIVFEDLNTIGAVLFAYMPSSIEILEPEEFRMKAGELTSFVNEVLGNLHQVDARFKNVNIANKILEDNSMALLKNVVILMLRSGEKDIAEISKNSGITEKELEPFLERFVKEGMLKKKEDKYVLAA